MSLINILGSTYFHNIWIKPCRDLSAFVNSAETSPKWQLERQVSQSRNTRCDCRTLDKCLWAENRGLIRKTHFRDKNRGNIPPFHQPRTKQRNKWHWKRLIFDSFFLFIFTQDQLCGLPQKKTKRQKKKHPNPHTYSIIMAVQTGSSSCTQSSPRQGHRKGGRGRKSAAWCTYVFNHRKQIYNYRSGAVTEFVPGYTSN